MMAFGLESPCDGIWPGKCLPFLMVVLLLNHRRFKAKCTTRELRWKKELAILQSWSVESAALTFTDFRQRSHALLGKNLTTCIIFAEASCAASLRTAKAVVQEAGPSVSPALKKLAKNSEGHAETAFHTTVAEQGLALEVPLTEIPIAGGQSFPVLLLSDWMKLILRLASDKPFSFDSFV